MTISTTGKLQKGFTLLEMIMALVILSLIFTATVVSLRGKWKAESAQRAARQLFVMWKKTRSRAWREGCTWTLFRDEKSLEWRATPLEVFENLSESEIANNESERTGRGFSIRLSEDIQVAPEMKVGEKKAIYFYADGHVEGMNLLIWRDRTDVWRLRSDWSGTPVLDFVRNKGDLSKVSLADIERRKTL